MADLILLDIHDFDVILGMDLLSRHHATKDCYRKEVRFYKPRKTEVVLCGLRKILPTNNMTVMWASKILRKLYQRYLAYVISKVPSLCYRVLSHASWTNLYPAAFMDLMNRIFQPYSDQLL